MPGDTDSDPSHYCNPPDGPEAAGFIIIDEDSIDNNMHYWPFGVTPDQNNGMEFSEMDVNEDKPAKDQRDVLRYFRDNAGVMIQLQTGEVGDEGWFAPQTIPDSWAEAGPTSDGLCNFLATCENYPTFS